MAQNDGLESANRKAQELRAALPRAVRARYDRRIGRVVISLNTNLDVAFAPRDAEGLENATPAQLDAIEISPSGFGIYFPKLDADIYLPALLEGVSWFAEMDCQPPWRGRRQVDAARPKHQRPSATASAAARPRKGTTIAA